MLRAGSMDERNLDLRHRPVFSGRTPTCLLRSDTDRSSQVGHRPVFSGRTPTYVFRVLYVVNPRHCVGSSAPSPAQFVEVAKRVRNNLTTRQTVRGLTQWLSQAPRPAETFLPSSLVDSKKKVGASGAETGGGGLSTLRRQMAHYLLLLTKILRSEVEGRTHGPTSILSNSLNRSRAPLASR